MITLVDRYIVSRSKYSSLRRRVLAEYFSDLQLNGNRDAAVNEGQCAMQKLRLSAAFALIGQTQQQLQLGYTECHYHVLYAADTQHTSQSVTRFDGHSKSSTVAPVSNQVVTKK